MKQWCALYVLLYSFDVIKWKHLPCYRPFVLETQRSPVNSPHKGQWRVALMFIFICAWINSWFLVNDGEAGDLRRHRAHHDVIVMTYVTMSVIAYKNQWQFEYLFNRLFRHTSKGTSGLCEGNSLVTSGFTSQKASNGEYVEISSWKWMKPQRNLLRSRVVSEPRHLYNFKTIGHLKKKIRSFESLWDHVLSDIRIILKGGGY